MLGGNRGDDQFDTPETSLLKSSMIRFSFLAGTTKETLNLVKTDIVNGLR